MIKTWQDRCMKHPDHQSGMVSHAMIQARMQEEIDALRAALAQHEPEPVAWIQPDHLQKARQAPFLCRVEPTQRMVDFVPLYTAPPQRKPLTVDQIYEMYSEPSSDAEMVEFARAIERAHGIGGEE